MDTKKIKKYILIMACLVFGGFNYLTHAQQNNLTLLDSDNDGLVDAEEKVYGTDPYNPDTDGDGYSDGVEVKSGYDPLKPAPNDKIYSSVKSSQKTQTDQSLTEKFGQNIKTFIETNDQKNVSTDDINSFVSSNFSDQIKESPSFENLPTIDTSKIKIKKQSYEKLSEDERKKLIREDSKEYLNKMLVLFYTNLPSNALTNGDIKSLTKNITTKIGTLSTTNPDYDFFRDFAEKIRLSVDQSYAIEVPESLLDDHIKTIRIAMGFLEIKDDKSLSPIENDPLSKMIALTRGRELMNFAEIFLAEEIKKFATLLAE